MSVVNVHHDLALAKAELVALRSDVAKLRKLAAEVVRTHDAPGGCRGPVGWTAMGRLAEYLSETRPAPRPCDACGTFDGRIQRMEGDHLGAAVWYERCQRCAPVDPDSLTHTERLAEIARMDRGLRERHGIQGGMGR